MSLQTVLCNLNNVLKIMIFIANIFYICYSEYRGLERCLFLVQFPLTPTPGKVASERLWELHSLLNHFFIFLNIILVPPNGCIFHSWNYLDHLRKSQYTLFNLNDLRKNIFLAWHCDFNPKNFNKNENVHRKYFLNIWTYWSVWFQGSKRNKLTWAAACPQVFKK